MIATVILLNWNGWKDTIECLESLLRLHLRNIRIVVCDNASTDGSLAKIKDWARGDLAATCANQELTRFVLPAVPKPLSIRELTRREAESAHSTGDDQLVLIQNGDNLGFAGGCNVGLRHALGDPNCRYFWLLNNDTIVTHGWLEHLLEAFDRHPDTGIMGPVSNNVSGPQDFAAGGKDQPIHQF